MDDIVHDVTAYGAPAIDLIIQRLLHSPRHDKQWVLVWALQEIGDPRAIEPLWTLFNASDGDLGVQDYVLRALSILKDSRVYEVLVPRLESVNINVKGDAIWNLGILGDARAVTLLLPLLESDSEDIRLAVISSLGRLRDRQAVAPLIVRLSGATAGEMNALIEALGRLAAPETIPVLRAILNRDDGELFSTGEAGHLRSHAVDALARFEHPDARMVLSMCLYHSKRGVRRRARRALQKPVAKADSLQQ